MAKRKTKNEIEITSNEINDNKENKEIIENKENDNKTTKKKNEKAEYTITKKSEGVYIRKLRRL